MIQLNMTPSPGWIVLYQIVHRSWCVAGQGRFGAPVNTAFANLTRGPIHYDMSLNKAVTQYNGGPRWAMSAARLTPITCQRMVGYCPVFLICNHKVFKDGVTNCTGVNVATGHVMSQHSIDKIRFYYRSNFHRKEYITQFDSSDGRIVSLGSKTSMYLVYLMGVKAACWWIYYGGISCRQRFHVSSFTTKCQVLYRSDHVVLSCRSHNTWSTLSAQHRRNISNCLLCYDALWSRKRVKCDDNVPNIFTSREMIERILEILKFTRLDEKVLWFKFNCTPDITWSNRKISLVRRRLISNCFLVGIMLSGKVMTWDHGNW